VSKPVHSEFDWLRGCLNHYHLLVEEALDEEGGGAPCLVVEAGQLNDHIESVAGYGDGTQRAQEEEDEGPYFLGSKIALFHSFESRNYFA